MPCTVCENDFSYNRSRKRFERRSVNSLIRHTNLKLKDYFIQLNIDFDDGAFVCQKCYAKIVKINSGERKLKRLTVKTDDIHSPLKKKKKVVTPVKRKFTPVKFSTLQKQKSRNVAKLLSQSKYLKGLKTLFKKSKAARNACFKIMQHEIQREVFHLCHPKFKSIWRKLSIMNLDSLMNFGWKDVLLECQAKCPVLLNFLTSTLNVKREKIDQMPKLGAILGIIVFAHKPQTMNLLQKVIGLQLWLSGCSGNGFARLNHLGLTMSKSSILNNVDRIKSQFDKDLLELKKTIEDGGLKDDPKIDKAANITTEECQDPTNDKDVTELSVKRCLFPEVEEETDDELCQNHVKGYTIVFDNVNQMTYASHTSKEQGNKIKNMVQAYAAVDRVECMCLDDNPPSIDDVENIPLREYLPNEANNEILRFEYTAAIGNILKDNMPCFATVQPASIHEHEFMTESSTKSKLIPLGILEKDECKLADMINIMEEYHKYVPSRDGKPVKTILYGDGLSCERANDAQLSRFNGEDDWARLRGLLPSIQEWHKRNILLADTYKLLFDIKSKKNVGTLSYVKNYFRHTNVKDNVHHSFNPATDMLRFTTTSYVLAKACEILNLENLVHAEQISQVDQSTFEQIVQEITDMAFSPPNIENVFKTDDGNYCVCTDDKDGEWIMCDNALCTGKWFHLECMGLQSDNVPKGNWFCSRTCRNQQKTSINDKHTDHIFEYSKAVLCRGLGELVRHNAVRNNDGEHMLLHWKEDMVEFFNYNHPKYFIAGHKLLTHVIGGASERIKHQLTWNRTVNIKGGPGHNIEMDLQMEFLNKEYKEAVRNSKGNLTAGTIARHGDMIGIKKTLGLIIDNNIACSNTYTKEHGQFDQSTDIMNFVNSLIKHKCLKYVGQRSHKGFEHFKLNTNPQIPNGLRMRLKKHLKKYTVLLRNLTFM